MSIHFLFWLSEILVYSQLAKLMISLECKLLPLFRKYINVKMIVFPHNLMYIWQLYSYIKFVWGVYD